MILKNLIFPINKLSKVKPETLISVRAGDLLENTPTQILKSSVNIDEKKFTLFLRRMEKGNRVYI